MVKIHVFCYNLKDDILIKCIDCLQIEETKHSIQFFNELKKILKTRTDIKFIIFTMGGATRKIEVVHSEVVTLRLCIIKNWKITAKISSW